MILIVDDEEIIRDLFCDVIKDEGHDVDTAKDGNEAMEKIRKFSFNLVITDINMPGLKGIDLLKETKKINPSIKVVIVTGYGTPELESEAMAQGANGYIHKPINIDQIKDLVKNV